MIATLWRWMMLRTHSTRSMRFCTGCRAFSMPATRFWRRRSDSLRPRPRWTKRSEDLRTRTSSWRRRQFWKQRACTLADSLSRTVCRQTLGQMVGPLVTGLERFANVHPRFTNALQTCWDFTGHPGGMTEYESRLSCTGWGICSSPALYASRTRSYSVGTCQREVRGWNAWRCTVSTFCVNVIFEGVDMQDDAVLDCLELLPDVHWRSQNGVVRASAFVSGVAGAIPAVDWLVAVVVDACPSARPVRTDRDLVSISDIADRIGVDREAVRHWVNGTRGCGGFPLPVGVVSNNQRVYEWGAVSNWLNSSMALGDDCRYLADDEAARCDLFLAQWRRRLDGHELHNTWVVEPMTSVSVPVLHETSVYRPLRSVNMTTVIGGTVSVEPERVCVAQ